MNKLYSTYVHIVCGEYLEVVVRHHPMVFGRYKDVITDDVHDAHYDRIEYRI